MKLKQESRRYEPKYSKITNPSKAKALIRMLLDYQRASGKALSGFTAKEAWVDLDNMGYPVKSKLNKNTRNALKCRLQSLAKVSEEWGTLYKYKIIQCVPYQHHPRVEARYVVVKSSIDADRVIEEINRKKQQAAPTFPPMLSDTIEKLQDALLAAQYIESNGRSPEVDRFLISTHASLIKARDSMKSIICIIDSIAEKLSKVVGD